MNNCIANFVLHSCKQHAGKSSSDRTTAPLYHELNPPLWTKAYANAKSVSVVIVFINAGDWTRS